MTVKLTRPGCAPTGVVSRAGDRAPETRVSLGSLATCTSGRGGLLPECLDRVEALADKHGIDRDFSRRLAAGLHRYEEAA